MVFNPANPITQWLPFNLFGVAGCHRLLAPPPSTRVRRNATIGGCDVRPPRGDGASQQLLKTTNRISRGVMLGLRPRGLSESICAAIVEGRRFIALFGQSADLGSKADE
jgi:hypothetical protein